MSLHGEALPVLAKSRSANISMLGSGHPSLAALGPRGDYRPDQERDAAEPREAN
jgi:hypothetical protein